MSEPASRISSLWEEYAPRIQEAQKRDAQSKEEIFLPWYEERIGKLPAVQLTPKRYLLLSVSNALIGEDSPDESSLARFLWIVSPHFSENKWKSRWFLFKCRYLDAEDYIKEIGEYLDRAFRFQPGSSGKSTGGQDWVSGIIDTIASEYGWPMDQILETPLSILFLLCGRIKGRYTGKPITFSNEADELKAEYLKKVNEEGAA